MLKKKFAYLLGMTIAITSSTVVLANGKDMNIDVSYGGIKITLDEQKLDLTNEAFIYNGVTYLPVRDVATATGKYVGWDSATKTVILSTDAPTTNTEVDETKDVISQDKTSVTVVSANGKDMNIDVSYGGINITLDNEKLDLTNEAFIYNGVTYLPVRDVATATGKYVGWDSATKTVILSTDAPTTNPKSPTINTEKTEVGVHKNDKIVPPPAKPQVVEPPVEIVEPPVEIIELPVEDTKPQNKVPEEDISNIDTNNNGTVTIAEAEKAGFTMPIRSDHWLYKYMRDNDKDGMVGEED